MVLNIKIPRLERNKNLVRSYCVPLCLHHKWLVDYFAQFLGQLQWRCQFWNIVRNIIFQLMVNYMANVNNKFLESLWNYMSLTYKHCVCWVYSMPFPGVTTPAVVFPMVVVDVDGPVIINVMKSNRIWNYLGFIWVHWVFSRYIIPI